MPTTANKLPNAEGVDVVVVAEDADDDDVDDDDDDDDEDNDDDKDNDDYNNHHDVPTPTIEGRSCGLFIFKLCCVEGREKNKWFVWFSSFFSVVFLCFNYSLMLFLKTLNYAGSISFSFFFFLTCLFLMQKEMEKR